MQVHHLRAGEGEGLHQGMVRTCVTRQLRRVVCDAALVIVFIRR